MCYNHRITNDEETSKLINQYNIDINEYLNLSKDTFGDLLNKDSTLNNINNNLK